MGKTILSSGAAWALAFATSVALAADEPPRMSLSAVTIGALGRTDLAIGMLEARAVLSPYLFVSAAPTLVAVEGSGTEQQLRASASLLMQLGPIRLDDRNLWVFSDAGTTRYRNRLRLTAPIEASGRILRFQLVDEAFYEQGGRGWFRNMIGAGVGLDISRSYSVDAYWMLQDDKYRAQTSLFVVVLVARVL